MLLPGSKATLADLAVLRAEGWDIDILAHRPARRLGAGPVRRLPDAGPQHRRSRTGVEGPPGDGAGLGLLDGRDGARPATRRCALSAASESRTGAAVDGYEIHMGRTTDPGCERAPMLASTAGRTARSARTAG